jgi:hypothetical protein
MSGPETRWPWRGQTARCSWEIWGEIPNWGVLGEDLRHGLLHWLRNYLTERMRAEIYSLQRRWRTISQGCAGGRRGKEVLALGISGFHCGSPSAITGHAYHDSQRRGLAFKHVAHNGERSTSAKSIPAARRASGYGEPHPCPSPSWSSAKIFTPSWLSPHQRTRIAATAWITT